MRQRYIMFGVQQSLAEMLARVEEQTAQGITENTYPSDAVERVTGRSPLTFDAFLEYNRAAWGFGGLSS